MRHLDMVSRGAWAVAAGLALMVVAGCGPGGSTQTGLQPGTYRITLTDAPLAPEHTLTIKQGAQNSANLLDFEISTRSNADAETIGAIALDTATCPSAVITKTGSQVTIAMPDGSENTCASYWIAQGVADTQQAIVDSGTVAFTLSNNGANIAGTISLTTVDDTVEPSMRTYGTAFTGQRT